MVDPRVARSRQVVLEAALAVLGGVGYGGLTIEAVAARAGVGKSTIYRHWSGKADLVEDAVRSLKAPIAAPGTGTVRDRVVALLRQISAAMAGSTWSSCLPAIIDAAERDPEMLAIHARLARERRQVLVDLLAEGVAAGEVRAGLDLELVADCLVGPLLARRLLLHEPLAPGAAPALVAQVLGAAEAPTHQTD
ncbi:MAG: TetR/AcrR family transcriptional regulator [Acidimicrobiales bacterium]